MKLSKILTEGGNVFDLAGPIDRENIKPTLKEFMRELIKVFPKAKNFVGSMKTLGSVGKKPVSGDIDLALSTSAFDDLSTWGIDQEEINQLFEKFKKRSRSANDEMLMRRAFITAMGEQIEKKSNTLDVSLKSSGAGSIFFAFPQHTPDGKKTSEYVQIDVNVGDVDWLSFSYFSDRYEGSIKGLHRTQLILALFGRKGYLFSHTNGVKNKETGEFVAKTPQQAVDLLNKLYNMDIDLKTLENYFKLQEYIRANISEEELNDVYSSYIRVLDKTRADIPEDLQQFWIDNQDRLGLTGKFLPDTSKLKKYATQ
jgi:hypothetical protein